MTVDQLQDFNNDAFKDYNEKALVKCPNCPRTFLPDRLEIHLRSCKGPHTPMKGQSDHSATKTQGARVKSPDTFKTPTRPKTLICYIWQAVS